MLTDSEKATFKANFQADIASHGTSILFCYTDLKLFPFSQRSCSTPTRSTLWTSPLQMASLVCSISRSRAQHEPRHSRLCPRATQRQTRPRLDASTAGALWTWCPTRMSQPCVLCSLARCPKICAAELSASCTTTFAPTSFRSLKPLLLLLSRPHELFFFFFFLVTGGAQISAKKNQCKEKPVLHSECWLQSSRQKGDDAHSGVKTE